MKVEFKYFSSAMDSWDALFQKVADFATDIGPRRLIGISHSEGKEGMFGHAVITVWYWDQEPRT